MTSRLPTRNLTPVSTIVFEGGGIAGIGEVGAWSAVEQELARQHTYPTAFGGTSAGAIIAMLCAAGYSPSSLRKVMDTTPWKRFMPSRAGVVRDFFAVLTKGSFSDLAFAEEWLKEKLEIASRHTYRKITFKNLEQRNRTSLSVVTTNEATMTPQVFSPATTPDVPVYLAVLASMAIPEVWPSVMIDGTPYCDGGVLANFPLRLVAGDLPSEEVVGICIDYEGESDVEPYSSRGVARARRILKATRNQRIHHPSHLYPSRVITVPRPKWAKATAFDLSPRRRAALWAAGTTAAAEWIFRTGDEP